MKYFKLYEDFINEYPFTVADKVYSKELYDDEVKSITQYYGDKDTAKSELDWYISSVDDIYKKGGVIYRGLYANNEQDIKGLHPLTKEIGEHWGLDYAETKILITQILEPHYNEGYNKIFILEVYTPPNNISIKRVDIAANIEEKEINIIDFSILKLLKVNVIE